MLEHLKKTLQLSKMSRHLELLDAFKLNKTILQVVGAWNLNNNKYRCYKYVVICITFSVYLSTVLEIIQNVEALDMIYTIAAEFQSPIKFIIFCQHFRNIPSALNIFTSQHFQPKNKRQTDILQNAVLLSQKLQQYYVYLLSIGLFLMYIPCYLQRILPLLVWLPVPYDKPIFFEIVFLYVSIGAATCAFTNISVDCFLCISWIQLEAQFDCICDTVRNLSTVSRIKNETKIATLINCIEHYKTILKYVKLLNKFYSEIITTEVVFSTMAVCWALYLMSMVQNNNLTTIFTQLHFLGT